MSAAFNRTLWPGEAVRRREREEREGPGTSGSQQRPEKPDLRLALCGWQTRFFSSVRTFCPQSSTEGKIIHFFLLPVQERHHASESLAGQLSWIRTAVHSAKRSRIVDRKIRLTRGSGEAREYINVPYKQWCWFTLIKNVPVDVGVYKLQSDLQRIISFTYSSVMCLC